MAGGTGIILGFNNPQVTLRWRGCRNLLRAFLNRGPGDYGGPRPDSRHLLQRLRLQN